jgi:hypothetical protein
MNCCGLVTSPSLLVLCGDTDLASVHALVGNEGLGVVLELVGVAEGDPGQRSATTAVVDNLLDYTTDVTIALRLPLLAIFLWCARRCARSLSAVRRCSRPPPGVRMATDRDVRNRACGTGQGPCSGGCWP